MALIIVKELQIVFCFKENLTFFFYTKLKLIGTCLIELLMSISIRIMFLFMIICLYSNILVFNLL